jgi:hypothetical protein
MRNSTLFLERIGLGKLISFIKRKTKINKILEKLNKANKSPTEKEKLDDQVRKKIFKTYSEDIKHLEKLIHKNLSSWKK